LNGSQAADGDGAGIFSSFLRAKSTIRDLAFNGPDHFFEKNAQLCGETLGTVARFLGSGSSPFYHRD
jgi:hypothetical protein